jgi:anti-sigma factor RsiW
MGELSHHEIEELLGAYALDAVEPDEVVEIEEHLSTCPRCRAELSEHREVAGLFAFAGQAAPPGLWDRITAGMQEAPPEFRIERMRDGMVTPGSLADQASDGPVTTAPARVLPLTRAGAHRRRRSIGMRTFVASAAAAAVVVAALAVGLVHENGNTSAPSAAATQAGYATMHQVEVALHEKGSRRIVMTPPSGHGASLDAVVTPSGVSYLYHPDLTPLGADRTYQLWGVVGDTRVSYALLGTNPAPVVRFDAGPGAHALAVTDEVASGVAVTHQPFVVEGTVSPAL